jgi:hypothetical protein
MPFESKTAKLYINLALQQGCVSLIYGYTGDNGQFSGDGSKKPKFFGLAVDRRQHDLIRGSTAAAHLISTGVS